MSTATPNNRAEARFRSLVDHLGAIVWEARPGPGDGEAVFTFVSDGAEALLGHPTERWLSDPRYWLESIDPRDRARVRAALGAAVADRTGADVEYRTATAAGREVWLRTILRVLDDGAGDGPRLHGVTVDVTERHTAESRLRRLRELADALSGLLTAREIAAVVASQGKQAVGATAVAVFLRVGADELEISGYDGFEEEAIEEFCRVPLSRDIPAAEAVRTGEALVLDTEAFDARYPQVVDWRKLAGRGQFIALPLAADQEVLGALALRMPPDREVDRADRVVLDVLARTCAQALQRARTVAAEREADAVLDTIITTAPDGFALFDTDLRYVRVNDALAAINGVPAADHLGRTLAEIVPGIAPEGHEEPLRQVLRTGEPVVDLEVRGFTASDPDREHVWLVSYYPVPGAAGTTAWLGSFVVDITARKRAEERQAALAALTAALEADTTAEQRMAGLAGVVVPRIADACRIALRDADGALYPVAGEEPEGVRSRLAVELHVAGRRLGELELLSLHADAFDEADRAWADELARRASVAVDNARLRAAERQARGRVERQYAVAAALADALTPADVAGAIVGEVVDALNAEHATVWLVVDDGLALELIGQRGFTDAELDGHRRTSLRDARPVADAIRQRRSIWFDSAADADAAYPTFAGSFERRGLRSSLIVPLLSTGRAVGGLFVSAGRPRAFGPGERALAEALAAQAGQALERARLFELERQVSVTLQRSLLPAELPELEGLELAVRYVPAAGLEAGGDFYEALPLPGGALGIAVGDVVGRGATAAAAMGQLRSALRAFAQVDDDPAAVLARLSAFASTVGGAMAATAIAGRLDPATGELRYACAGHPWPLLVHADGSAEYLQCGRGIPLACLPEPQYAVGTAWLRPGSTLLLYTDGLTERRGPDVDSVLERLRTATSAAAEAPLQTLLDEALDKTGETPPGDDVALLAVRLQAGGPSRRLRFAAEPAQVPAARADLRRWLGEVGVAADVAADLLLAAGEAVANAVEHSGSDEVAIELTVPEPGVVGIVVLDRGAWRPPVIAPHRGRGFGLMRMLVDHMTVERSGDGTVVRLRHRFAAATRGADGARRPTDPAVPCAVEVRDGVAVVSGELDMACAARIRDHVIAARPHTVDLSAVAYLDSTGSRMLLEVAAVLGSLVVVAPADGAPRRALELSGLVTMLDVRDA